MAGEQEAAAVNGDEGAAAWRDRMGDLRELFAAAVDRIDRDGRLARGWTVPAATDRVVGSILSEVAGPPA